MVILNKGLNCDLPHTDVNRDFIYPKINIDPKEIELIMISEEPPAVHSDYYYKNKNGSFFISTRTAFSDAGTYAQDNTPAAYRLFWSYGPTKNK